MIRLPTVVVFAGVALALVSPVVADDAQVEDGVRTYTNADLKKFGPPSDTEPVPFDEQASWKFVSEFIEHERARIDADRAYALARRQATLDERMADRRRYTLPYSYYGYGHGYGYDHGPTGHPHARHGQPGTAPPPEKLSGVDAFPSNRRRAEREAGR